MTDTMTTMPKAPLGVGKIISESFSILFSNFVKVLILGFIGSFAGFLVNGLFLGFETALGVPDPEAFADPSAVLTGSLLSLVIGMAVYGIIIAMLIQLAYDAKLGRNGSLREYFTSALPPLFAIVVLSLVVAILAGLGMIALVVGGLWVYAVFYVFVPAAVIERTGFGSLGRSAGLTKEYRWPIVGLFLVMAIIIMVISFALTALSTGIIIGGEPSMATFIGLGVVLSAFSGLAYGLSGIATALTYARLREVKEGVAVDQIASVFD